MGSYRGTLTGKSTLYGELSLPIEFYQQYQEKNVTPSEVEQVIEADSGYAALGKVTVSAIPSNYGRITFNGYELTVE